ncbi:uncharacterized protein LOC129944274 [Eupeodes corollae]|uniref:uncharacterized protein LOC129944274 n=1 Tax=Eupeodes corollae TaxID=290404 RepID=UPI0024935295|nr:uncharacterized protein LOC129944274 [Eupeodes corollae]
MNFKVQIVLVLFFYTKVSTTSNLPRLNQFPKVPPNLSLYKYEGNFYPSYASSKIIHPRNVLKETETWRPMQFTRYLNPVHLSQEIYHDDDEVENAKHHPHQQQTPRSNIADDDATGSEYQVAMKVQPLVQQVISSGKPHNIIEESGKSHQSKRQLKLGIMSPETKKKLQLQSFHNNHNQNGLYTHKNNELPSLASPVKSVPNKIIPGVSRHYHDILLKYKSPEELVFGHVLSWPEMAQKRIEKKDNNHFKGQVIWADKTGGYGEHYWDLAQGAL